jgi:ribose transport system substrate-binding protein
MKKVWPRTVGLLGVAAGMALVAGAVTDSAGQSPSSKIVVGYLPTGISLPIIADAYHAAEQEAAALHVEFKAIANPQYETAEQQNNEARNLLAEGVSALIIDPADSKAIGQVVALANQDHVPVVMQIGGDTGEGQPTTYIAADEVKVGYDVAVAVFKALGGKGEIGYIQGSISQEAGALREKGFRQALEQYPDIKLVAYGVGGWLESKSQTVATNMLTAHPDLKAIITNYDGMTDGALAAVQAAHAHVLLAGVDGECQTLNDIWQGTETVTGDELWTNIGAESVKVAVDAAEGKSIPPRIYTPSYVIDKQAEQEILQGTYPGETPILKEQIQKAVNGC